MTHHAHHHVARPWARTGLLAIPLLLPLSFACASTAAASSESGLTGETFVMLYSGKAWTDESKLRLRKPDETDVTFDRVYWEDESWKSPPYYGLRAGHWFEAAPEWGVALDYAHPKVIADTSRSTSVSGVENGAPVGGVQPISDHVEAFEMTDGHNTITLNAMRRFQLTRREDSALRRLTPYVGLGAGVGFPHVDATVDGVDTFEYQLAGPVYQTFAGASYSLASQVALVLEYKLSYQDLELDVGSGATIDAETFTHQAIVGLEFRW